MTNKTLGEIEQNLKPKYSTVPAAFILQTFTRLIDYLKFSTHLQFGAPEQVKDKELSNSPLFFN